MVKTFGEEDRGRVIGYRKIGGPKLRRSVVIQKEMKKKGAQREEA